MTTTSFQQLANFIWSVADLLRGPYRPPQYERVMLPLTVLRCRGDRARSGGFRLAQRARSNA